MPHNFYQICLKMDQENKDIKAKLLSFVHKKEDTENIKNFYRPRVITKLSLVRGKRKKIPKKISKTFTLFSLYLLSVSVLYCLFFIMYYIISQ